MEKQKQKQMDWVVRSNREYRYKEIRELIGKLTLIEKYIRIRLCNGTLHKDEDALHILLDLHRDALCEIGMNVNSLKIIDSEEEEAEEEEDEMVEKEEVCVESSNDNDTYEDECGVSVPTLITKEVLLAHNFNYHPTQHYCEKDFGDVNVHIQLACGGGVSFCHIKRRCKSSIESWERDDIELTTIRYVYQLQQALELIGADCGDTF